MEWEEVRNRFDRLYGNQAAADGLPEQTTDNYQAELLKLYDGWAGVQERDIKI